MRRRTVPALVLAGGLLALPAVAQTVTLQPQQPTSRPLPDMAYGAYQQGFYIRAFVEATRRLQADANDTAAMMLLGELHRQGLGLKLDLEAAAGWYRLSHERGDANGTYALAQATLRGSGVAKDEARGLELLREGARRGNPSASHDLALLLLGTGQPADQTEAARLLAVAAAADLPDAMHAYAVLLAEGRGVQADPAKAVEWLRRASAAFHEPAEISLAIMLFNGQGTERDEIGAADLFTRAALRGNPIAQNRLARLYATGRGRTRDTVEAAAWHINATAQGRPDAELDALIGQLSPEDRARATDLAARRMSDLLSRNLTRLFQ